MAKNKKEQKANSNKASKKTATMARQRWGVVDVGSNTVRMNVYEVYEDGSFAKSVTVKAPTALASYVDDSGVMIKAGIKAACHSIEKMRGMASVMSCSRISVFATAALRNCVNSASAIAEIQKQTGCIIDVLSGEEEARFSLEGALQSVDIKTGLFFDIGGGSTELMCLSRGEYVSGESLPLGSLTVWSDYTDSILPTANELASMETAINMLVGANTTCSKSKGRVCGIGGSMRLALRIARQLGYSKPGDRTVSKTFFEDILVMAIDDPNRLAKLLLRLNPARIHTFLSGCVIAKAVLDASGRDEFLVAKSGVREGYLRAKIDGLR